MAGNAIQVDSNGAIRVKNNGIVVAGAGDPCCCGSICDSQPECLTVTISGTTNCCCGPAEGVQCMDYTGYWRAAESFDGTYTLPRISAGFWAAGSVRIIPIAFYGRSNTACSGSPVYVCSTSCQMGVSVRCIDGIISVGIGYDPISLGGGGAPFGGSGTESPIANVYTCANVSSYATGGEATISPC